MTYTLTAENSRNVHIELHKTDMITGESLQNAVFSLYSDEEHEYICQWCWEEMNEEE